MKKQDLIHFLQPFTDEVEILLAEQGFHGERLRPVDIELTYRWEDGEGVVVIERAI